MENSSIFKTLSYIKLDSTRRNHMINKKSIWFLTLFSLILVLSVYYVTMPNELLLTTSVINQKEKEKAEEVSKDTSKKEKATVKTEESEILTSIRMEANEKYNQELEELKTVMTSKDASTEEKNNAFEKIKSINNNRGKEELLEKKILEQFKYQSCVLINGTDINITVSEKKHDTVIANNIMRLVQSEFDSKMYITVKFQK